MRRPSGDHREVPAMGPPSDVTCTRLEPAVSDTQISELPVRSEQNAILVPSGENWGQVSTRVEAINFVAERLGSVAVGTSICQILMVWDRCSYASRFPRLAIAGFAALSPPTVNRSGVPPEAEILQRLLLDSGAPPLALVENTSSRPSAVQARRSQNGGGSSVKRVGSPPAIGTRKIPPAALSRLKATVRPSGEMAGAQSPADPTGGDVSLHFSRLSMDARKMLRGACASCLSESASSLPSGDQLGPAAHSCSGISDPILRSGPPSAGMTKIPRPSPEERTNAM